MSIKDKKQIIRIVEQLKLSGTWLKNKNKFLKFTEITDPNKLVDLQDQHKEMRGTLNLNFEFTAKQLFSNEIITTIGKSLKNTKEIKSILPSATSKGYLKECKIIGFSNNSPFTINFASDIPTRCLQIFKYFFPSAYNQDVEKCIKKGNLLASVSIPPLNNKNVITSDILQNIKKNGIMKTAKFYPVMQSGKNLDNLLNLYGNVRSQHLNNTYVVLDKNKSVTPEDSLLSFFLKSDNTQILTFNDNNKGIIPEGVDYAFICNNKAIDSMKESIIQGSKKLSEHLLLNINDCKIGLHSNSIFGGWQFDQKSSSFVSTNDTKVHMNKKFNLKVQVYIEIRYYANNTENSGAFRRVSRGVWKNDIYPSMYVNANGTLKKNAKPLGVSLEKKQKEYIENQRKLNSKKSRDVNGNIKLNNNNNNNNSSTSSSSSTSSTSSTSSSSSTSNLTPKNNNMLDD